MFSSFISNEKGEALVRIALSDREVVVNVHANRLLPVADTLHFGLKPGHVMIYVAQGEDGHYVLHPSGRIDVFQSNPDFDEHARRFSTLTKQKLFGRGFLRVRNEGENAIAIQTITLWPLHLRTVRISKSQLNDFVTISIDDRYFGKKTVSWNTGGEEPDTWTSWWHQRRTWIL